jgi:energy-coupling factor transport system substrate-specific component
LRRTASHAEDAALLGITAAGLTLFVAPLLVGSAFPEQAALFTALIATSALAVLALALQTHRLSPRLLAVLAALVAVDATLRLVIVIGLLGFSPIFFLIIAGGYVMGPSFGFALGALTLLLSAVLTAGLGPWLPYQMLASGWVGLGAGYLGAFGRRPSSLSLPRKRGRELVGKRALIALAVYGSAAGFLYGVLLDLWEWPFLLGVGSSPISWAPGLSLVDLARRFGAFYVTTSLVYDAFRAAGNLLLICTLGLPVIAALERFRRRFLVNWTGEAPDRATAKMLDDVGTPA